MEQNDKQGPRMDTAKGQKSRPYRLVLKLSLMALLLATSPFSMKAQTACIYPAVGVPGQPGPPDWTGTFNPPVNQQLNDPRWNGASSLTWADGTSGDTASFQALYDSSNNLYLSWSFELTPNGTPQANVLYVGFTQNGGATPANFAMTISLQSLSPVTDSFVTPGAAAPVMAAYSVDGSGNLTKLGSVPSWMSSNTSLWITLTGYTVQIMVPNKASGINSGLNLGTDFSMWFEMQEVLPPATPNTVWDAIFPDGRGGTPIAADVVGPGGTSFNTVYPSPGTWANFHLASGAGDPKCTLGGVSIASDQIGTNDIDPVSGLPAQNEIQFSQSGTNTITNQFFAAPTNGMSTAIAPGGITATFRIADWGSVADPNAPWTTIPGGQNVPSTLAIPAGSTAGTNALNFNWTVQNIGGGEQWLTEFRSGSKPQHQCMLVELAGGNLSTWAADFSFAVGAQIVDTSGNLQQVITAGTSGPVQPQFNPAKGGTTSDQCSSCSIPGVTWLNEGPATGPGLTFLNNSVFRNMEFTPASVVSQDAAISILGLKPIGVGPRDVYLYVQTVNMPSVVQTAWKDVYNKYFGAPTDRSPQRTGATLARMTTAEINQTVPQERVYVFHDTGEKITIDSKDYRIVHPQSSFGFYVLPHADVYGWIDSIKGASEIASNFYKISVPNNGVAHVTTQIEALEGPPAQSASKFAVFLDLGANFPQGMFSNVFNNGFSLNAGLEYMATSHFSAEGIFGYHRFPAKTGDSANIYQFSADAKAYLMTTGKIRPFVNGGVGGYAFSSGSTYFGGNFGGGTLFTLSPRWGVQGSYNFDIIKTPGNATKFSTVQGGLRYVF
jgi:hypothetical protein